jgi:hypothetical protein
MGYVKFGSGYIVDPNETAGKIASDNDWLKLFGLSAEKEYPAFKQDANGITTDTSRGLMGSDAAGGVYNPEGYSNTQDYLQKIAGFSRDQTKGTALENVSDHGIWSAFNHGETPGFANDLHYDPKTGWTSNVNSAGTISMGGVRDAIAKLTGQQNIYDINQAAPLMQPGEGSQATRQADFIKSIMGSNAAPMTAATRTTPTTPAAPAAMDEERKKELDLWKQFIGGRA